MQSRPIKTVGPGSFWITHWCNLSYSLRYSLVSFFGGSTKSTVEVKSQFKNGHLLLKNVSLLSPRPVTDTRLEHLVVMVQSLTGTIRMPI